MINVGHTGTADRQRVVAFGRREESETGDAVGAETRLGNAQVGTCERDCRS